MIDQGLTDRIYEAAFVPEMWPQVIERIGEISVARSGSLLIMDGISEPRWKATEAVEEALGSFIESGTWRSCAMAASAPLLLRQGFVLDSQVLSPEVIATDPAHHMQRELGLGSQLACVLEMPTEEFVVWTLEHELNADPPQEETVEQLNKLIGHLARSSLIAARLGLEKAGATVSALQALGLPAAVLSLAGRVRASNPLFETVSDRLRPAAFGSLSLAHASADALFQEAIKHARRVNGPVRSIPMPASEGRAALVVHVLPLLRSAYDIFSGGDVLVTVTEVKRDAQGPSAGLLSGLFDLTVAEARLASALAAGKTLQQAAELQGIRVTTARAYLARVFHKTGTQQQSQLVALLKGTQAL